MRMNVKLFTLQMSLPKTEELCRNSIAKYNSECSIPRFTENESGIEKFVFKQNCFKASVALASLFTVPTSGTRRSLQK
jgi:hypothetical protein